MIEVLADPRHPRAAPQFICSGCRKKIGKSADHYLLEGHRAPLCYRCFLAWAEEEYRAAGREDRLDDYRYAFGTRAWAAVTLGIWPERKSA